MEAVFSGPYYLVVETRLPDGTIKIEKFLTETGQRYVSIEFPPDYELDDNINL